MGKQPAFQFYPGDWSRDLEEHPLEIEGAWIRICCKLWWSDTRGEATKSLQEWARILRISERKTIETLKHVLTKSIADGSILDNQNITIISRRMKRDHEISQIRYRVGILGGNPALKKPDENLVNQKSNQNDRSSSSSSSSKKKEYTANFLSFYSAYPKRKKKDDAFKAWVSRNGDMPSIEIIIAAIEAQKKTEDWKKEDGKYIPYPASWLRAGQWDDEVETKKKSIFL